MIKTPISYYGGKQMMVKEIVPRFPDHLVYTEPFFGGGAIFFAKQPAKIEVINDLNSEVINFYQVLQNNYDALDKLIQSTLHSRKQHQQALIMYQNPELFDDVKRAWAFWILCNEGFACQIGGSWGYDKSSNSIAKKVHNAKARFKAGIYKERLELTQIECTDAIKVIESRDRPEAFHYCDPPYYNSNCGHYEGYTLQDYERLLTTLQNVKGKFMLSSNPSEVLNEFVKRNGWYQIEFKKPVAVSHKAVKNKIEVLTANYPIEK